MESIALRHWIKRRYREAQNPRRLQPLVHDRRHPLQLTVWDQTLLAPLAFTHVQGQRAAERLSQVRYVQGAQFRLAMPVHNTVAITPVSRRPARK